jgi:hypothetical protein
MPAIIIPVIWGGGAAILLGSGWYVFGHMSTNAVVLSSIGRGKAVSTANPVGPLSKDWSVLYGTGTTNIIQLERSASRLIDLMTAASESRQEEWEVT